METERHDIEKEFGLGDGLLPDAGPAPAHEATWPRLGVIVTALVGIGVIVAALLFE